MKNRIFLSLAGLLLLFTLECNAQNEKYSEKDVTVLLRDFPGTIKEGLYNDKSIVVVNIKENGLKLLKKGYDLPDFDDLVKDLDKTLEKADICPVLYLDVSMDSAKSKMENIIQKINEYDAEYLIYYQVNPLYIEKILFPKIELGHIIGIKEVGDLGSSLNEESDSVETMEEFRALRKKGIVFLQTTKIRKVKGTLKHQARYKEFSTTECDSDIPPKKVSGGKYNFPEDRLEYPSDIKSAQIILPVYEFDYLSKDDKLSKFKEKVKESGLDIAFIDGKEEIAQYKKKGKVYLIKGLSRFYKVSNYDEDGDVNNVNGVYKRILRNRTRFKNNYPTGDGVMYEKKDIFYLSSPGKNIRYFVDHGNRIDKEDSFAQFLDNLVESMED